MECTHLQDKVALICFGSEIANLQLATHIKIYLNNNFIPQGQSKTMLSRRIWYFGWWFVFPAQKFIEMVSICYHVSIQKKYQVLHVTYE